MLDDLWSLQGYDRLMAIDLMKLKEYDQICKTSGTCAACPLSILYRDGNGYSRLLCVDVATRSRVLNALKYGGRFLNKGEKLGDEK